jgi:hypothetical protein
VDARGRPVGMRAIIFAIVLTVVGGVLLLISPVPVDEDGEALTTKEIERLDDANEDYDTDSPWEVFGPLVLVQVVVPPAIAAVAFRGVRGPRRSRMTLFCMIGMAVISLMTPTLFVLAAVIALGVANFQIRRAEMRAAVAATAGAEASTSEVIDVDEVEPEGPDPDQRND